MSFTLFTAAALVCAVSAFPHSSQDTASLFKRQDANPWQAPGENDRMFLYVLSTWVDID
jgi:hypothetical protein